MGNRIIAMERRPVEQDWQGEDKSCEYYDINRFFFHLDYLQSVNTLSKRDLHIPYTEAVYWANV